MSKNLHVKNCTSRSSPEINTVRGGIKVIIYTRGCPFCCPLTKSILLLRIRTSEFGSRRVNYAGDGADFAVHVELAKRSSSTHEDIRVNVGSIRRAPPVLDKFLVHTTFAVTKRTQTPPPVFNEGRPFSLAQPAQPHPKNQVY